MLIFILIFGAMGVYALFIAGAGPDNRPVERFVEQPERGLVWAGLRSGKEGTLCAKLLEAADRAGKSTGCTHGPDPAPAGIDVRTSVEPVRTGEEDITARETTSGSITTANASLVPCDGDGQSGNRIQALYVRASDKPDRYATFAASFQTYAGNTNNIFVESGLQTGSARNLRFVHDANCSVVVTPVTISPTGDDSYGNTASELQSMGYNRQDRKYLLWVDANIYCGIAGIRYDDRATTSNANNIGPSYARVDSGCWGLNKSVEAHEIMHNLGGVQLSAPHTTNGWHCIDDYDRMCYTDAQGVSMTYNCATTEESRFDCGTDDYFFAGTPPSGSYLSSHWNAANSAFLIIGSSSGGITPPPPPPTTPPPPPPTSDTTVPVVSISAPTNGSTIGNKTNITASASDNSSVTKTEIYIDGILKTSSTTSGSISYSWNSRKASRGTHTITVKAYDAAGNVGQSSISVTKN